MINNNEVFYLSYCPLSTNTCSHGVKVISILPQSTKWWNLDQPNWKYCTNDTNNNQLWNISRTKQSVQMKQNKTCVSLSLVRVWNSLTRPELCGSRSASLLVARPVGASIRPRDCQACHLSHRLWCDMIRLLMELANSLRKTEGGICKNVIIAVFWLRVSFFTCSEYDFEILVVSV